MRFAWPHCPAPVRDQVNALVAGFRQLLGENLIGIYLHGSLATGGFNPNRSDVDLLIVTARGLTVEAKRDLAELLRAYERQPRQLELSALTWAQLHPWRYPPPYDFHYGDNIEADLANGNWQYWNDSELTDPDLAAHIMVLNRRGLCLYGRPIRETFPPIPPEHFRQSLLLDFDWGLERIGQRPLYFVLNACRSAAFLRDGEILSKDEGGRWGLRRLPVWAHMTVNHALRLYRGQTADENFFLPALNAFVQNITPIVKS